jgi:cysteine desulfuration protein SufE
MSTLEEKQLEIENTFAALMDDNELRYQYIIDLGKKLPPISEEDKKDIWLVKGCQSKVWLIPEKKNQRLYFRADSDAIITKGIVSLIMELLNGRTKEEILRFNPAFFERIGLYQHLTPVRANGLLSMIRTIKEFAEKLM